MEKPDTFKRKYILSHDDKIAIGQCFNLAHNEFVAADMKVGSEVAKQFILDRAEELFFLKKDLEESIGSKIGGKSL